MHAPFTHVAPPPPQSASVQHAAPQLHTAPFFTYGAAHVKSHVPFGVQVAVPLTGAAQGPQFTDAVQPVSGVLPTHCPPHR